MKVQLDLSEQARQESADSLKKLMADTYTLYLKTHGYHWNVEGPRFSELHALFETHYQELWLAVDEIAERIRTLGIYAPASYQSLMALTELRTEENAIPSAEQMIYNLAADHETLAKTARKCLNITSKAQDESSADLAIARLKLHEKTAWILRSSL